MTEQAATHAPAPAPDQGERSTLARRVLVIDDEPAICQIMRDLFADVGVEVDTAADGREGLTKLTTNRYDVVLTDYFMPGLSGLRLFDRIREVAPDVPVVLLTGSALIADSVPTKVVVLKKPIALQELLDCLGPWLGLQSADHT